MKQLERSNTEILSPAELQLLVTIRNHVDGGKGYFPAIGSGIVLRETDPEVVGGHLAKLYDRGLICPTPEFGFGAYDVTAAGRQFLIERGFAEQPNWTIAQALRWLFNEKLSPALVRLLGLDHLAE